MMAISSENGGQAMSYGRCPTCGKGTPRVPYSCEACIAAIPVPPEFEEDVIEIGWLEKR